MDRCPRPRVHIRLDRKRRLAAGRGPNRDAKATDFTAPKTWPKELTKKWSVSIGDGVATPSLVGDKLYVFSRQGSKEIIRRLDAHDREKRSGRTSTTRKVRTGRGGTSPVHGAPPPSLMARSSRLGFAARSRAWTRPARSGGARTSSRATGRRSTRPARLLLWMGCASLNLAERKAAEVRTSPRSSPTRLQTGRRSGNGRATQRHTLRQP